MATAAAVALMVLIVTYVVKLRRKETRFGCVTDASGGFCLLFIIVFAYFRFFFKPDCVAIFTVSYIF